MTGDEDRGRGDAVRLHAAQEIEAAHLAEPDVDDHHIDDALVQQAQRRGHVMRGDHVHAFLRERDLDRVADVLFVVEHEHDWLRCRHAGAPAA